MLDIFAGAVTEVVAYAARTQQLGSIGREPAGFGSDRDPATAGSKADRGDRTWIYVYNDSGADLAAGHVCVRKAATQEYRVRKSTQATPQNTNMVVGVAQHAIANGSCGWILRIGLGEVLADTGGLTVDQAIVVGNAVDGAADTIALAGTTTGFGFATETVAATALATCWIFCQG